MRISPATQLSSLERRSSVCSHRAEDNVSTSSVVYFEEEGGPLTVFFSDEAIMSRKEDSQRHHPLPSANYGQYIAFSIEAKKTKILTKNSSFRLPYSKA